MNFRKDVFPKNSVMLNVTAFVDILLCLLVFLISSWAVSQQETDLGIKLPEAKSGTPSTPSALKVVVNVEATGEVTINKVALDDEALLAKLKALAENDPDQVIILRADKKLAYDRVLGVLDICRRSGIRDVAFSALPTQQTAN